MPKRKEYTVTKAFNDLGKIDKSVESGKITKGQHNSKSKAVLKRLVKGCEKDD